MNRSKIFITSALLVLCTFLLLRFSPSLHLVGPDFLLYYLAGKALLHQQDFYNPAVLETYRAATGYTSGYDLLIFFYPPWTAVLFAPLAALPFQVAAFVFFFANIIALLAAAWIIAEHYDNSSRALLVAVFAVTLFYPHEETMAWGQLGILLLLGAALLLRGVETNNTKCAVGGALLLALKPHLFLPLGLFGLYQSRRNRTWRQTIVVSAMLLLLCCLLLKWYLPAIFASWYKLKQSLPVSYVGATAAGVLRLKIQQQSGQLVGWPLWAFPLAGSLTILSLLYFRKLPDNTRDIWPLLIPFSLFFAPYAWFHDQSVIALSQGALAVCALNRKNNKLLYALAAVQIGLLAYRLGGASAQHHFFFLPLVFIALWKIELRRASTDQLYHSSPASASPNA